MDYQRKVWVETSIPNYEDCFDFAVNLLFDETPLASNPEKTIGIVLKDKNEVLVIQRVTKAIDELLNKLGTDQTDEEYMNDPDWGKLVEASQAALTVIDL